MALIAHYRLDGDVADSVGNTPTSIYGSFDWVDGKFGKAAFTNSTSQYFEADTGSLRKDLSIAFWYRCDGVLTTWTSIISKMINDTQNEICLRFSADGVGMQCYYGNDTNANRIINFNRQELIPKLGEWVHITVTKESGGQLRLYSAGELVRFTNIPNDLATDTGLPLKVLNHSSNGVSPVGAMHDLRIYDHALSPREVRDLALGLVTHINFDSVEEPTQNYIRDPLFKNGLADWSIWGVGTGTREVMPYKYNGGGVVRCTLTNAGNIGIVSRYDLNLAADEWVVVSVDVRASRAMSLNYTYLMRQNNGNSSFASQPIGADWRRVDVAIQNHTADDCGVLLGVYPQVGDWVEFANPMLERGKKASAFTEGVREASGNNLALQSGSVTGDNFRLSEESPIGRLCYDNRLEEPRRLVVADKPAVLGNQTLAMWLYPTSFAARTNPWNRGYGSEGTITQEVTGRLNYFYGSGNGNTTPYLSHTADTPLKLNQWNHVCHVRDIENNVQRWYINGVQDPAVRVADLVPGKSTLDLWIGDGYAGPPYPGMIADVREYASALTAEEAKELYQQRAAIDSNGSLHCSIKSTVAYFNDWEHGNYYLVDGNILSRKKGSLIVEATTADPRMDMYRLGYFDPAKYPFIHMRYRVLSGNASAGWELYFTNANAAGATGTQRLWGELISDGEWHTSVIDGRDHSAWLGSDITGWRLDFARAPGVKMEIAYIALASTRSGSISPTGEAGFMEHSEVGVTRGLVAWYPLDGDTLDYAGNITAYPQNVTAVAQGYSFAGVDSSIRVPYGSHNTGTESISVSAWVRLDPTELVWNTVGDDGILSCGTYQNSLGIAMGTSANTLNFIFRVENNVHGIPFNISRDEWYFVTLVYDATTQTLSGYVNGEGNSIPVSGSFMTQEDWYIGGYRRLSGNLTGTGALIGDMADVRIHNVALTPEEVAIQYQLSQVKNSKLLLTDNCAYTANQFKEVIC